MSPNVSSVIKSCRMLLENGTVVDCFEVFKFHKYISHEYSCFVMFEQGSLLVDNLQLNYKTSQLTTNPLLSITAHLPPTRTEKLKLAFAVFKSKLPSFVDGNRTVLFITMPNYADLLDHVLDVGRPCKASSCERWAACGISHVSSAW